MRGVASRHDEAGRALLRNVNNYLRRCFSEESPPHVSELAVMLDYSVGGLSRLFRARTGVKLSDYFKDQQIACAKRLLRSRRYSVTRIAGKSGFGTERTFFRAFKQRTGMTPDQYRIEARR